MEPTVTGGTIATIVGMILSALAFVLALPVAWIIAENRAQRIGYPLVVVLVGALAAGAFWWGMYPWKFEYHHWVPVYGVVDTVDSRLVSTGEKSMEDKFVVKFVGHDDQYGVLDTRAAGLKPGDKLTITCVRIYQWAGTHGYDCNFVSLERAR